LVAGKPHFLRHHAQGLLATRRQECHNPGLPTRGRGDGDLHLGEVKIGPQKGLHSPRPSSLLSACGFTAACHAGGVQCTSSSPGPVGGRGVRLFSSGAKTFLGPLFAAGRWGRGRAHLSPPPKKSKTQLSALSRNLQGGSKRGLRPSAHEANGSARCYVAICVTKVFRRCPFTSATFSLVKTTRLLFIPDHEKGGDV